MYSISNLKQEDLEKIEVKNQAKIIQLMGKKLNPKEAFQVIKKDSMGFTKMDEKAQEADRKFLRLLQLNGIKIKGANLKKTHTSLDLQAEARARALALLELEIELAA